MTSRATESYAMERLSMGRKRIWELDLGRGVFILLMLMDHTFFDIGGLFGAAWTFSGVQGARNAVSFAVWYWSLPLRDWVHDAVLWGFLLLAGLSTALTRNHVLRCAKLGVFAAILTCATVFAQAIGLADDIVIRFGVLHMLALSCLVSGAIYSVTRHNRLAAVLVPAVLAAVLYLVNVLYLNTHDFAMTPSWLCVFHPNMGNYFVFTYGDYFPLLGDMSDTVSQLSFPYLGRVLVGTALIPLLYPTKQSLLPRLEGNWAKPLCWMGRHTIWVVLLHQLLIPLLLALITGWFITPGNYGLW